MSFMINLANPTRFLALVDQLEQRSADVDERVWQLPLEKDRYRKLLDSVVADMRNIGGPYGGTITASIFDAISVNITR